MRNNGEHRHTAPEIEELSHQFMLWYFDPHRTGTMKEWAEAHKLSQKWCSDQKKKPEFVAKMMEFRTTYREEGDEAIRNLIRFSHSPEPRVALPAIKILVEVMGYNAPQKVEYTANGMSLMDYLAHVGQRAVEQYAETAGEQGIPAVPTKDAWQTAPEKLN